MITRNYLVSFLILLAGLAAGFLASRGIIDFLAISYHEKDLSELARIRPVPDSGSMELPLRIVDLGGVGVLPDTAQWGNNYEHNQHFFEDVMQAYPPFIEPSAFSREKRKLAAYAGRMGRFGYNGDQIKQLAKLVFTGKKGNLRRTQAEWGGSDTMPLPCHGSWNLSILTGWAAGARFMVRGASTDRGMTASLPGWGP